jgi:hypothetical protein
MSQERIQRWILQIIRHIQTVILQEGDNKYKEGPFEDRGVARETRDWIDIGALDLGSKGGSIEPENTI